ncbi:RluA family pseudouridine synthase [Alterisphingorhabdus coralli]|uniref:RluA family pseudouridine synthase n=1 Tax=Alterisphingorhabdus coralli TaxID=3071408 RepID=A0AA97F5P6_9SPHN|nr:RluA family pseudouridine synthase [Parasphingorhabdus sp. SCSIO 66989]WOE74461.1 RluA family pseudouridine synthase [Parasphingorhabdus sp. SCSIO 66989]
MSESEQTPRVREFRIAKDDDDIRVDRWFARHMGHIGFGTISKWARTGQIRVNGRRVAPGDRLSTGQLLRVPPEDPDHKRHAARPVRELSDEDKALAESLVIEKTGSAIILNKPPGLATQGGSKTYRHIDGLLDAYRDDDDPRPRLVHRLDKDTSGVLLIARTPGSAAFFSKRFSGRSAKKVYWALVMGLPEIREGQIDLPLAKQPGTGGEKMYVDHEQGQPSRSRYRVIEHAGGKVSWVELHPLTGRTHQLRVHMAAIGHPIVGDAKYGGKEAYVTGPVSRKMHLHARRLVIEQPEGHRIDVQAELPPHFAETMESMGFDTALGDAFDPVDSEPLPDRANQKRKAKAHAKQVRKARRGERRSRSTSAASAAKAKTGKKPGRKPATRGKAAAKKRPARNAPRGRRS